MGVTGLLKLLQPHSDARSVSHFKGQTLGVDAYSWLHRAAASCAEDLLRGIPTPKLVQSIDNRVRVYEANGINLYFVFDGSSLGVKGRVEAQRRKAREAARSTSSSAAASSTSSFSSSSAALKGLDITPQHAAMLIAYLKAREIKFVVAPYEADAQLVWLQNEGLIDAIISEDSDMLVFGAKSLLTKCDARTGDCIEVNKAKLPHPLTELSSLRALAIISGCDYSPGVPGMGPIKTRAMIARFGGSLDAMLANLMSCQRVDAEFMDLAKQADLAFQFQRVWNPVKCCMTFLNDPPDESVLNELSDNIVGKNLSRAIAHRMAIGKLNPLDHYTELIVGPVVARFVQRMKPVAQAKPSIYSTPLSVSRAINRKLYSPAAGRSVSTPENINSTPTRPKISSFFKPVEKQREKENTGTIPPARLLTPDSSAESINPRETKSMKRASFTADVGDSRASTTKILRTDTVVDSEDTKPMPFFDSIPSGALGSPTKPSQKVTVSQGEPRLQLESPGDSAQIAEVSTEALTVEKKTVDQDDKLAFLRKFAFTG